MKKLLLLIPAVVLAVAVIGCNNNPESIDSVVKFGFSEESAIKNILKENEIDFSKLVLYTDAENSALGLNTDLFYAYKMYSGKNPQEYYSIIIEKGTGRFCALTDQNQDLKQGMIDSEIIPGYQGFLEE